MTDPGSPSGLPLGVVCQGKQSRSTPLPPTTPASCVPWRWKAKGCGPCFECWRYSQWRTGYLHLAEKCQHPIIGSPW